MRHAAGRTWQATLMGDRTSRPAAADYLGLSDDPTPPADADTALAGEIATSGLARKQATFAYTPGQTSYTLTATWTAADDDVAGGAVSVEKAGVFTAADGGTMPFSGMLLDNNGVAAPASIGSAGDSITVTETVSLA